MVNLTAKQVIALFLVQAAESLWDVHTNTLHSLVNRGYLTSFMDGYCTEIDDDGESRRSHLCKWQLTDEGFDVLRKSEPPTEPPIVDDDTKPIVLDPPIAPERLPQPVQETIGDWINELDPHAAYRKIPPTNDIVIQLEVAEMALEAIRQVDTSLLVMDFDALQQWQREHQAAFSAVQALERRLHVFIRASRCLTPSSSL